MEWINTTVGEYCPFIYGKSIKKEDQLQVGFPVFGSNGIYAFSAKELVSPYAVIIGRKGSVGKIHLSLNPCWVSDTAFYVKYDSLKEAYFSYFLLSTLGLDGMNTDAAVPGLNRENAHRLEIRIPKLEKDRAKIIDILMQLEQKIHLNNQTNQTLESIAQAIFKSWFIDFEPVKAKIAAKLEGKDSELSAMCAISGKSEAEIQQMSADDFAELKGMAALFPNELVESELGEVPRGWKVGCVGDISTAKGGYAFKSSQFVEKGHPVIKIKNITGNGEVDIEDTHCIEVKTAANASRFILSDGNLVMAMTGATVGKIGLINTYGKLIYLNQRVAKFESKKFGDKISYFLFCLFKRKEYFEQIVGTAQGSAQPNISSSGIESIKLIVPSSNLIINFIGKVDIIFQSWLKNCSTNSTLRETRDSLLPKLLSGEIDMSELQIEDDVA